MVFLSPAVLTVDTKFDHNSQVTLFLHGQSIVTISCVHYILEIEANEVSLLQSSGGQDQTSLKSRASSPSIGSLSRRRGLGKTSCWIHQM